MIYSGLVYFRFSVIQLLVAFVNLFFRQSFPMKDTEFNGWFLFLFLPATKKKTLVPC